MRLLAFLLTITSLAIAQNVNLPKPQGPLVEGTLETVNAVLRIQGCARDQEGKVVCAVQIQSNARTNQQVSSPHSSVRAISARGFSYPGYLVVEGGQLEQNRAVFSLPAGNRVAGRVVFPEMSRDETFIAVLYLGGLEFRGLPIGQALPPAAPAQTQAQPQAPGTLDYRKFVVGPFTFELISGPKGRCCHYFDLDYKVTAAQDATLQIDMRSSRTILEGGLQEAYGEWSVSGGRSDFIAGIPVNVRVSLGIPQQGRESPQILYTEFRVSSDDGKTWEKVVLRNIPVSK
jgi:hypothetical protein